MGPELYWIRKPPGGLAISTRPRGDDWLEDEVDSWRHRSVNVVVSLLTDSENRELGLEREAAIAGQRRLQFYSFPIEDRGIPLSPANTDSFIASLSAEIQRGKNIAIHCRQGIGRSALVSAALLISAGDDLARTLKIISAARGVNVPETQEQRTWLAEFAKSHAPDLARENR